MHTLHCLQYNLYVMHSDLRRLDLNLLLVFDALFRHGSVVAAADEMAISPSACSHALSRLRDSLGDELFFRAGNSMRPTLFASEMAADIGEALRLLSDRIVDSSSFSPGSSTHSIVIAATDFTAYVLMPTLAARLEHEAPNMRMKVVSSTHRNAYSDLMHEGAHFVIGFSDEFSPSQEEVEVLHGRSDDYVVAARKNHPRIGKSLSMQQYLAERHVAVKPWGKTEGVIDTALRLRGWSRDVAVEVPNVMTAPSIVANSHLLLTLPRSAARQLESSAGITVLETPFDAPTYTLDVYFHRRHLTNRWHQWVRAQIIDILR